MGNNSKATHHEVFDLGVVQGFDDGLHASDFYGEKS